MSFQSLLLVVETVGRYIFIWLISNFGFVWSWILSVLSGKKTISSCLQINCNTTVLKYQNILGSMGSWSQQCFIEWNCTESELDFPILLPTDAWHIRLCVCHVLPIIWADCLAWLSWPAKLADQSQIQFDTFYHHTCEYVFVPHLFFAAPLFFLTSISGIGKPCPFGIETCLPGRTEVSF